MKGLYLVMTAAAFVCGCASAQVPQEKASAPTPVEQASAPKEENCGLQVPPKGVGPEDLGGVLVFIYPKTLLDNYTGCQTLWAVSYEIKMRSTTHFKNGIPTAYERYVNNKFNSCQINGKEEKAGPGDFTCPGYDAVNQMQQAYQQARPYKGEIPPDLDPRK